MPTRFFVLTLALLFALTANATPKPDSQEPAGQDSSYPGPKVSPVKTFKDEANCSLTARNKDYTRLFLSGGDMAWMNIDGQELALRQTGDRMKEPSVYKNADIVVEIWYGEARQVEGGGAFDKAIIKVTRRGKSTTIEAQGGCGC